MTSDNSEPILAQQTFVPRIKSGLRPGESKAHPIVSKIDKADADPLGLRRILLQAARDLFGTKDVQDAITASYVWMADQMGHIALGLIPALLYCWLLQAIWPKLANPLWVAIGGAAMLLYWLGKEIQDYRDCWNRQGGQFRFDSSDVAWNVKTALFYIALGTIAITVAFINKCFLVPAVLLALWPAFRIAFWWLRRKVAFQQAGLPYLFRLTNFSRKLDDPAISQIGALANLRDTKVSFWRVCFGSDPAVINNPNVRHLLLTGELGSGKTSLAVGIGTEFAFTLGIGRYLTAAKLIEEVAAPDEPDTMIYKDGRILWPLDSSELLVIDDVDAGVRDADGKQRNLVRPEDFQRAMSTGDSSLLTWLASRRSVWVIGDSTMADAWAATIGKLMKLPTEDIVQIKLGSVDAGKSPTPFSVSARRVTGMAAGIIGCISLVLSAVWWMGEGRWGQFQALTPEQAFADGSFGLELAPLKYILVASKLSGRAFQLPGGPDWPERFGFLSRPDAKRSTCVADAPRNLPVGFTVSNRLPGSATPMPVKFVGLSCAACHSAQLGKAGIVLGPGSQTADVIAFTDAFLNATADRDASGTTSGLTGRNILAAYDAQHCPGEPQGALHWLNNQIEAYVIDQWLSGLRNTTRVNVSKYDMPFHGTQLGEAISIPTGPSRTRPFRSVVRNTLDLPGADNAAYSKVPFAGMQRERPWSQFDGSVGDPTVRSMIAIFTSGASPAALNEEQIAYNVRQAAKYTLDLGRRPKLPGLHQAFPDTPVASPNVLARGREIYQIQCSACHGSPSASGWHMPKAHPTPSITPLGTIGTDPSRINFRYASMLPTALETLLPSSDPDILAKQKELIAAKRASAYAEGDLAQASWWAEDEDAFERRSREFPAGHRLAFGMNEVELRGGYLNGPIEFAWLRAPYLHNGSVLSLSELIGLTPRESKFCRGRNEYDPVAIGLRPVLPQNEKCPAATPFLFDTAARGNSNAGHRYPAPNSVKHEDLEALLAYLGTL